MRVSIKFSCKCLEEWPVEFRKPGPLQPAILYRKCPGCLSEYMIRGRINPDKAKNVLIQVLKMKPTQMLIDLLNEEEKWKQQQAEISSET